MNNKNLRFLLLLWLLFSSGAYAQLKIEITGFVHPKVIPQLADAETVAAGIRREPGVRYAAFVPNARGSSGYGLDYTKRVDHDWGGQDRLDRRSWRTGG